MNSGIFDVGLTYIIKQKVQNWNHFHATDNFNAMLIMMNLLPKREANIKRDIKTFKSRKKYNIWLKRKQTNSQITLHIKQRRKLFNGHYTVQTISKLELIGYFRRVSRSLILLMSIRCSIGWMNVLPKIVANILNGHSNL